MFQLIALLVVGIAAEPLVKPYYDLNNAHIVFKNFVHEHGKTYDAEEYFQRFEIFKESLLEINERNARHPQTVFDVTRFADLTLEERRAHCGSGMLGEDVNSKAIELHLRPEEITAPDQWDWRDHGAVTHVKNQGGCGSCWIFSATGAIEGQYAIKHNKTLAFSEQQSLDCVKFKENDYINCYGGLPDVVMAYHQTFGLVLEKDYPYTGNQSTCHEDPNKVVTKVTGYKVYKPDEETLKQLVYEKGPLSVSVDPADFGFYKGGILFPQKCDHFTHHAVLLVGYGVENGTKYWILKDSAGTHVEDQGYVKLVRGINACSMGTEYTVSCTVA